MTTTQYERPLCPKKIEEKKKERQDKTKPYNIV